MKKPYRNDRCPCGSGKKYKFCCGKPDEESGTSYNPIDKQQADYIIDCVDRDVTFLECAMNGVFLNRGKEFVERFCRENGDTLTPFTFVYLKKAVENDELDIYEDVYKHLEKSSIRETSSFGYVYKHSDYSKEEKKEFSKAQEDFVGLLKQGLLSLHQVLLFHLYVLDNISKRFNDYRYYPSDNWLEGQGYGALAHRGFDYLVGISLYVELQLGVHILDIGSICGDHYEFRRINRTFYGLIDSLNNVDNTNMRTFLFSYIDAISKSIETYSPEEELKHYRKIGALNEKFYEERDSLLKEWQSRDEYNNTESYKDTYKKYLIMLIGAICFNREDFFVYAGKFCPQCDFTKMIQGIGLVYDLFERENYNSYEITLFYMLDDVLGSVNGNMPPRLHYCNPADLCFNETDYVDENGTVKASNPAAKSVSMKKYRIRKIRMELYNLLSGKTIILCNTDGKVISNILLIPWLSNGKEPIIHSDPFDEKERPIEMLYSENIQDRKSYLNMEYRLTEIPVNCIEEYLNPNIYNEWITTKRQNEELQRINEELQRTNEDLSKHIRLNEELVKSLSHASGNYLNSEKLMKTGTELRVAIEGNPSIDKLHTDGLLLILQSEHETYLRRRLDSLVIRCKANSEEFRENIRQGLSKDPGDKTIVYPIEYAIRTVLARILTYENDLRCKAIKKKFSYSNDKWIELRDSFITDVLAKNDSSAIDWSNNNLCMISITTSDVWKKVRLIEDRSFFDLIVEITTELFLNALSHGDVNESIDIELGQAEEIMRKNRMHPTWCYIKCRNRKGICYKGGNQKGLETLDSTLKLINQDKRGVESFGENDDYESKAWLEEILLSAKGKAG